MCSQPPLASVTLWSLLAAALLLSRTKDLKLTLQKCRHIFVGRYQSPDLGVRRADQAS